jgi:hypothetical protein
MAYTVYQSAILKVGNVETLTGDRPDTISGPPKLPEVQVVISAFAASSAERFLSPSVEVKGRPAVLRSVHRIGGFFYPREPDSPIVRGRDYLLDIDVYDKDTETVTTYYISTASGTVEDSNKSTAADWNMIVSDVQQSGAGDEITIKLAAPDRGINTPIQTRRMLGLGAMLHMNESGTDANGTATIPHHADLTPTGGTNFRVDAIVRFKSLDGGIHAVFTKGGTPIGEWSLFTNIAGIPRFRMQDFGAVSILAELSTPITPGLLYHLTGVWDGSELYIVVNGVKGNVVGTLTTPYSGGTDYLRIGTMAQADRHINGYVYALRIYKSVPGGIDLDQVQSEVYQFAADDGGLIGEWRLAERFGDFSVNDVAPETHLITLANPDPWDPWEYSNTGPVGSAGKMWPLPVGGTKILPVAGDLLADDPVYHVIDPLDPTIDEAVEQRGDPLYLHGVDWVRTGGEFLNVKIPAGATGPYSIGWGPGYIQDETNTGIVAIPPPPFTHPAPGHDIVITGTGAPPAGIDGTHTVSAIARNSRRNYGRRLLISSITTTGSSASAVITNDTVGSPADVSWNRDGTLALTARPEDALLARVWTGYEASPPYADHPVLSAFSAAEMIVERFLEITWNTSAKASFQADFSEAPIGGVWTDLTAKDCLQLLAQSAGIGGSFDTIRSSGARIDAVIAPVEGATPVFRFRRGNTRKIELIRSVSPFPRVAARFENGDHYAEGDLLPSYRAGADDFDLERLLSPYRVRSSAKTSGASIGLSADEAVFDTALLSGEDAGRAVKASAKLIGLGYYIFKVLANNEFGRLDKWVSIVTLQDETFPVIATERTGIVIGIGIEDDSVSLYVYIKAQEAT